MSGDQGPQGLDEDAYLNAEKLFRKTGDLRYLVIAIGKPKSSFFDEHNLVADWAFEACQEYAEFIRELTRLERKRLKSVSVQPELNDDDQALYKRAIKRYLGHDGSEPVSFDRALIDEGVKSPDQRRRYHRYRQREERVVPQTADDEVATKVNRRIEERLISRTGKRRRTKKTR